MAKSKNRKNHKAKVNARNEKINLEKKKVEKMQKEFIMNLIKNEQERGLFENNDTIKPIDNGSNLEIDGPSI
jgi:hypothetical protein